MMKKILLISFTVTLLIASTSQEPTKTSIETTKKMEPKTSKRASALEAKLAKRAAQREEKTQLREAKLQKLHLELDKKAKIRATRAY